MELSRWKCYPTSAFAVKSCHGHRGVKQAVETINQKVFPVDLRSSRPLAKRRGVRLRYIPHNYFRLLDLSDILSVGAAESLQLLLLVTLAKLAARFKFRRYWLLERLSTEGGRKREGRFRRVKRTGQRGVRWEQGWSDEYIITFAPTGRNCL